MACRISTAIESDSWVKEIPFWPEPSIQPQLGVLNSETLDWLPFDPNSGILLQAPAYQHRQHSPG